MIIRRFKNEDAKAVSIIVGRNFVEINSKDYPIEEMKKMAEIYNADKILYRASKTHMYVVEDNDTIIGTGSIGSYWGSTTESCLFTIFVIPEYHNCGIGRKIIETLENDELFMNSRRIEIPASITACKFYEKMGYSYKDGVKQLDEEGHYRMEKFR